MCAARVEVLSDHVVAVHGRAVLGRGRAEYELRDFDPDVDVFRTRPADPPGSISWILLELGDEVGQAIVKTGRHDTSIEIEAWDSSAGAATATR